ncbi:MAG: hypothetical protein ACYTAS_21085 [Planctomycetota bacterium]|jgi:hypothetical protein
MTKVDFRITDKDDVAPVCPHCDRWLDEIFARQTSLGETGGKNAVYFCPHCLKVLGVGDRTS